MGSFTGFDVHIPVRGCSEDRVLFSEMENGGRLQRVNRETTLVVASNAFILWASETKSLARGSRPRMTLGMLSVGTYGRGALALSMITVGSQPVAVVKSISFPSR